MCMGTFAGCGSNTEETTDNSNAGAAAGETAAATTESQTASAENVHLDALNVYFVPSRDPEEIVTATEPLSDLLKNELAGLGYDVDSVNISVGTTYEAVGEALSAGTADVGFIPGGTYVLYDDGCDVILTATRDGLNKDSDNPADWNDGQPTEASDKQAVSYRALFIAGPSEKGQELADKVNSGEELTWDDLNDATWAVMGPTSASGYIYPSLWLNEKYGKGISDLANAVESDSYTTSLARLASGQADVMVSYGHIRTKYAPEWKETFGGTDDMVNQTGVIGVTDKIYNDMIAYSKTSEVMQNEDFRQALGDSFIEIANTDEGKDIISVFSQVGYEWGDDSNYDGEREAQELLKSLEG